MKRSGALAVLLIVLVSVVGGPLLATGSVAATPSGMVGVPNSNVSSAVPQHARDKMPGASAFEGSTMASRHASTTEVTVTTAAAGRGRASACQGATQPAFCADPSLALQIADNVHHEGRRVAVPASALRDGLGYVPAVAHVQHENGTRYDVRLGRSGTLVTIPIRGFSSNTVTFGGEVNISATPATDGSQFSYSLNSMDAAGDPQVELTGHTATEWDNISASAASPSSSKSISVAGNLDPAGNGANGDPVLSVTGHLAGSYTQATASDYKHDLFGWHSGELSTEYQFDHAPSTITAVTFVSGGSSGDPTGATVDVYAVSEGTDQVFGEGTLVKSGWSPSSWPAVGNNVTIRFDSSYSHPGGNLTLEFVSSATSGDGYGQVQTATGAPSTHVSVDQGGSTYKFDRYPTARVQNGPPANVSVSTTGASHSFGDFSDGETKSVEFPLSLSASSLSWSGTGGTIDYTLAMEERTETVDPGIEINGHWLNSTGTLSDGSTTTLTGNSSWLSSSHPNRINVSVGDGTLTADAPTSSVGLVYNHSAEDQQVVSYTSEKWSERYNVSHTYASSRTNADVSIPFAGDVIAMRGIEMRTNGTGGWSSISPSSYSLSGTQLIAQLGDVDAGTKVEVRANGSKVSVSNGSITVLDPTTFGTRLDSQIKLDSWADDSYIAVGGTNGGSKIHYTYNQSYSATDEHSTFTAGGQQHLALPNAVGGAVMRVSTIPVEVSPQSGEVVVSVPNPKTTEPSFYVEPGASAGDEVKYTFVDAQADTDYVLYSKTNAVVRDSGTASSPLTLTDDDSAETLQFQVDSSTGSSGTGGTDPGGILGGPISPNPDSPLNSVPVVLLAWVAAVIALFVVDRTISGGGGVRIPNPVPSAVPVVGGTGWSFRLPGGRGPLFWVGAVASTLVVFEFLSGGTISQGIAKSIEALGGSVSATVQQVGPLAGIVVVGLVGYYAYKRFIKGRDTTVVVRGRN